MSRRQRMLCLAGAVIIGAACQGSEGEDVKKDTAAQDPAVAAVDRFIGEQTIDKTKPDWKTKLPKPPKVQFDGTKRYHWTLTTNQGAIKIRLMPEVAPMHASSTVYLTRLGFYDGIVFHRVIPGFMAQGGDPLGRGTGGPGYEYDGEFDAKAKHDRPGILSMANRGPGTDGSQFFLTFVPTAHLDGRHTIFGEVVDGLPVVRELEKRGTPAGPPTERLVIESATVTVE